MTRTLKDYRPQHDEDCESVLKCAVCGETMGMCDFYQPDGSEHDFEPSPCSCGLDALLVSVEGEQQRIDEKALGAVSATEGDAGPCSVPTPQLSHDAALEGLRQIIGPEHEYDDEAPARWWCRYCNAAKPDHKQGCDWVRANHLLASLRGALEAYHAAE